MATFYNQATLSYNGNTTTSNITTGEFIEALSALHTHIMDTYSKDDEITFVLSIVNSSATDYDGLEVSFDLGNYQFGTTTDVIPLTYIPDSLKYYINGVLQPYPAVTAGQTLNVSPVSVPANGNTIIIYKTLVNEFAPLEQGASITNTATVSGGCIAESITAPAVITAETSAILGISKSISPSVVSCNGSVTYTFIIQNTGNTAATASDNVIVTDTFTPALSNLTVTLNNQPLTINTGYTYNETTGLFETAAGAITVPAATFTQDAATGEWNITPGSSILTVTGTI